eukprot:gene16354-22288_t
MSSKIFVFKPIGKGMEFMHPEITLPLSTNKDESSIEDNFIYLGRNLFTAPNWDLPAMKHTQYISRKHVKISVKNGHVFAESTREVGLVFHNNTRCEIGPFELQNGDIICLLGTLKFYGFQLQQKDGIDTPPPANQLTSSQATDKMLDNIAVEVPVLDNSVENTEITTINTNNTIMNNSNNSNNVMEIVLVENPTKNIQIPTTEKNKMIMILEDDNVLQSYVNISDSNNSVTNKSEIEVISDDTQATKRQKIESNLDTNINTSELIFTLVSSNSNDINHIVENDNINQNISNKKVNSKGSMLTRFLRPYECSICCDTMACTITLPCSHNFCYLCITDWASKNKSCPLCYAGFDVQNIVMNKLADNAIQELMEEFGENEELKEWEKRLNSGLDKMKNNINKSNNKNSNNNSITIINNNEKEIFSVTTHVPNPIPPINASRQFVSVPKVARNHGINISHFATLAASKAKPKPSVLSSVIDLTDSQSVTPPNKSDFNIFSSIYSISNTSVPPIQRPPPPTKITIADITLPKPNPNPPIGMVGVVLYSRLFQSVNCCPHCNLIISKEEDPIIIGLYPIHSQNEGQAVSRQSTQQWWVTNCKVWHHIECIADINRNRMSRSEPPILKPVDIMLLDQLTMSEQ